MVIKHARISEPQRIYKRTYLHGKETVKTAKRRGHLLDAAETRLPKASYQHSEQRNDDVQYLAIKLDSLALPTL
ncbi:hypothetical protein BPOR_0087g00110 [Botrytis porri]|uniref:Uncharacterized protein n=1 Tax=Botrytis porri TaxID=87229 RepID=A0A4Z1KZF8_9HELO|nr:hypothetical protein BPOR_0087g00110 [Botrytis porri]